MTGASAGPRVRLTGLHVYPVKSCAGLDLTEVVLTARGFAFDREWMVVGADGAFLTQREHPRLALVRTAVGGGVLKLWGDSGAGGVDVPLERESRAGCRVRVWKDDCAAWDEGDAAAAWLSSHLQASVRLVRFDPAQPRVSNRAWTGDVVAENGFSDGYPVLVLSEESVTDLSRRVGGPPLPMNRFRPNLVIAGQGPYVEDHWRELRVGSVVLRMVKPCSRCRIITIDQASAEGGVEPLRTLASYRRNANLGGVVFAQNAVIVTGFGERLRVGMDLELAGPVGPAAESPR